MTDVARLKAALGAVSEPLLEQPLADLGWLEALTLEAGAAQLVLAPGYAVITDCP